MADSDNTTTLPFVTRRRVLAGTAIVPIVLAPSHGANANAVAESADPAVALWRRWDAAQKRTERLCRKQQRLETRLARTIGFPCAVVRIPGEDDVTVHSLEALNWVLGDRLEAEDIRNKAEAEFAAHQARWDAADHEIGYSAALQAELRAGKRAQHLLEELAATEARSLMGVAGKLDAVLRTGEAWEECDEFPWPLIRSALDDLLQIGEKTASANSFPSSRRRRTAT
ncbi:hypothetical protein [Chelativorans sp.]|uniref:hypothetical protein n=1 Tax=Chelativorans sp. TaxID=2203393 RepID=UPI00281257AF|nr:hypothetical protein [Chelativorans sp.]